LSSSTRELHVLDGFLRDGSPVRTVIPGHRDLRTREKLEIWRDYIAGLWEGVVAAGR